MAYLAFKDKEVGQEEYVLQIEPEDWEVLKELVDETFAHMRSHIEKVKERENDDD